MREKKIALLEDRKNLLAALSIPVFMINELAGGMVALACVLLYLKEGFAITFRRPFIWLVIPSLMIVASIFYHKLLPQDDLLRHVVSWKIGFDYRAQYPWADIPKTNLWIGFEYILYLFQQIGIDKETLVLWVTSTSVMLGTLVIFFSLNASVPSSSRYRDLLLLVGFLGCSLTIYRFMMGRPEGFMAAFGATAWLVRSRKQAILWGCLYVLLIPFYWLSWIYAPFALLLKPVKHKILYTAVLFACSVGFWQVYSGDYIGLLLWLRGTLDILALENLPQGISFMSWNGFVFVLLIAWILATEFRDKKFLLRLKKNAPVWFILVWFLLPNQIRYVPTAVLAVLPFVFRKIVVYRRAGIIGNIHPVAIFIALWLTWLSSFPGERTLPQFAFNKTDRVYSEEPFAVAFYSEPGVSIDPPFAFGATRPEWRYLIKDHHIDCERILKGGFTHVVEKSLEGEVPSCLRLKAVQNHWRLWEVQR